MRNYDEVIKKQMKTGEVEVVETAPAAPADGWNKEVEVPNIVDPHSAVIPGPRSGRVNRSEGPKHKVIGVDGQKAETQDGE